MQIKLNYVTLHISIYSKTNNLNLLKTTLNFDMLKSLSSKNSSNVSRSGSKTSLADDNEVVNLELNFEIEHWFWRV